MLLLLLVVVGSNVIVVAVVVVDYADVVDKFVVVCVAFFGVAA